MIDDVLEFLVETALPAAAVVLGFGILAVIGAGLWRLFWWILA